MFRAHQESVVENNGRAERQQRQVFRLQDARDFAADWSVSPLVEVEARKQQLANQAVSRPEN